MLIFTVLVAFVTAAALTWRFCHPDSSLHILDHPNERSLHVQPTPRSGGVAVLVGLIAGAVVAVFQGLDVNRLLFLISAAPVAIISFLDDRSGVHAGMRLLVHVLAAALLLGLYYVPGIAFLPGDHRIATNALEISLMLLFVVWMTNLYNFMDGMDGFAGGMAIIGFITFAVLGTMAGDKTFALAALLVAGATAGFMIFNFPPAKIFLGDTGASTVGFMVAAFALWASRDGLFPFWLTVLVFSPFIVDATITLLRRLLRGERVWRPHKTHYYQKLVQLGWGHRRTVLSEYVLMLACSLSAVIAVRLTVETQQWLALVWLLIYAFLIFSIDRFKHRRARARISS